MSKVIRNGDGYGNSNNTTTERARAAASIVALPGIREEGPDHPTSGQLRRRGQKKPPQFASPSTTAFSMLCWRFFYWRAHALSFSPSSFLFARCFLFPSPRGDSGPLFPCCLSIMVRVIRFSGSSSFDGRQRLCPSLLVLLLLRF